MKIVLFGATKEVKAQVARLTDEMIEESCESCYHLVCCDDFGGFMRQCVDKWERTVGLLCNWGTAGDLRKILQQFDRFRERSSIILLTDLDWIREHGAECEGLVTDGILPLPLMSVEYKGCISHYHTFHRTQEEQYLMLRDEEELVKIYLEEILYMDKVDGRIRFHLPYGEILAARKMKDMEQRIDGRFALCDTEVMVNLQWIQDIDGGQITFRNGQKTAVNQKRREEVRRLWQEYLAGEEVRMLTEEEIKKAEEEKHAQQLLREQRLAEMMEELAATEEPQEEEDFYFEDCGIEELFDKKMPR